MSEPETFEPAIAALLAEMRRKLALPENRRKSALTRDPAALFEWLLDECGELTDALEVFQAARDADAVAEARAMVLAAAADIGNFAMMIVAATREGGA